MEDTYRFNPAVPDSWLVERLFIGETRLEQIYGCYDLRISRKLTDEELTGAVWMSALADKFPDSVKTTNVKPKQGAIKKTILSSLDLLKEKNVGGKIS